VAGALVLGPSAAAAGEPPSSSDATEAPLYGEEARAAKVWPEGIPRVRWWEWAGSGALLGGSLALRFTVPVDGEPNWRSGILFDEAAYDAAFITSPRLNESWRVIGDAGYFGSFAWAVVDPLIAGFTYDWDTTVQMLGMNAEAFAIYSAVITLAQLGVRRERPESTEECGRNPELVAELGIACSDTAQNRNRSFIGGHTGTAATAATLSCIHHSQLPLWGGGGGEVIPCVTGWLVTASVFTSRTVTGKHWVSDNALGLFVGAGSAAVPYFLHYHLEAEPIGADDTVLATPPLVMVQPQTGGAQVSISGALW